ncbi:MAG: hypothetical protein E6G62_04645, partial [Actinobacteria bacterium]
MARDWSELFITGEAGEGRRGEAAAGETQQEADSGAPAAERRGLFRRLRESMAKTRQALGSEIQATLFGVLDEHT